MAENLAAEDDPYRDPRVELVVAEGREYAARLEERGEKFDMVYVPIATLFGSSGHALTQTYLMSTEAMSLYFKMLKPGGYVAIYFKSVIADKLLDAVTKALGKEGISDRLPHLAAFNQGGGFVLLARPSEAISPVVRQKLYQAQPAKSVYNITQGLARAKKLHHLSDDNPFLYNDGALLSRHRALFGYNVDFMKYILMFTSVLIFLVFLTSIKNASSGAKRSRSAYLAAFVIMGVAYSMYQTGMIQRLMFLVGHPLLATSLVLPAMLAGTALGSFSSKRIFETKHALMRGLITLFLLVAIAGFALTEPIELILPNWSIWQRCALALVLSGIPSIMMGTYFPVVFNRLETVDEKGPLWAWLTNGLGGVLGSVLGIFAAMFLGFSLTILLVIPLYGLLSLWDATSNSNGNIAKLIDGLMSFMLLLGLGYILFISIV
ncbi:MAG: hypothetical protein R3A13_04425 [Bdellovibrionota bacterium]